MKRLCVLSIWLMATLVASSQELRCTVTINSDKIQGSNKSAYETLKQTLEETINTTRWTNMTFAEKERIECSMMIVVNSVDNNIYHCEMQLQSRRPVYNTGYHTTILNLRDKQFTFSYQEFDRLEHQPGQFSSNLAELVAYYCYLLIGYDADSYSRLGGAPYFQECENIVSNAQSASMDDSESKGWKAFDNNRNRYALINNLLDEAFRDFRNYVYEYHRLGLDEMANNVANGRARIAEGINILRETNRARPATYAITVFLDAKYDELVKLFEQGTTSEKDLVYETLVAVDPTRQSEYDKIKGNN